MADVARQADPAADSLETTTSCWGSRWSRCHHRRIPRPRQRHALLGDRRCARVGNRPADPLGRAKSSSHSALSARAPHPSRRHRKLLPAAPGSPANWGVLGEDGLFSPTGRVQETTRPRRRNGSAGGPIEVGTVASLSGRPVRTSLQRLLRGLKLPYLNCPDCRLTVYSAAGWAHIEACPRCGMPLGQPRSSFTDRSSAPCRPRGQGRRLYKRPATTTK